MGNLFGKSQTNKKNENTLKKKEINEKDRAILDLKIARDKLNKYQKKMEIESEKLFKQAQILLNSGNKEKALLLMKVRKHKLKETESVDSKLLTVMKMIEDIEWESHNIEVLNALKAGTSALNKLHEEMSLEDVERLMEETNEAIQIENEISALLAGQFSPLDETELEAELEAMAAQEEQLEQQKTEKSIKTPKQSEVKQPEPTINLPDVPQHIPITLPEVPNNKVNIKTTTTTTTTTAELST